MSPKSLVGQKHLCYCKDRSGDQGDHLLDVQRSRKSKGRRSLLTEAYLTGLSILHFA